MKRQNDMAIQDAFSMFMRGVETIDSGRVKQGRDIVWSAMALLLEAEDKLTSKRINEHPARCSK